MLSSPSRSSCYAGCSSISTESPLMPQMLSELAFTKEPQGPPPASSSSHSPIHKRMLQEEQQQNCKDNWSWTGLFCLAFAEDPDLYYDAEEILPSTYDEDGRHILTEEEQELLQSLRGGHQQQHGNHIIPTPNNLGSRSSGRRISLTSTGSRTVTTPHVPFTPFTTTATAAAFCPPHNQQRSNNNNNKMFARQYGNHAGNHAIVSKTISHRTDSTASLSASSSSSTSAAKGEHSPQDQNFGGIPPPPAPQKLPLRFLRAGKNDPLEGQRRYDATLAWRQENSIDTILLDAHPNFLLIKQHYPHYYHLKGHQGEPVFFEQPPKTNLKALKQGGIDLHSLVRHYTMVTEFQWQFIERDDLARSITVLDLEGMGMRDFVGECVEYVKMCSTFTGQHYPERAGHVIVVNVPRWFSMIWTVVKPMVDEMTLQKISIVRGKEQVFEALAAKIPVENIPPEYGGMSMPLGESPEEQAMRELMAHNNALAKGDYSCGGCQGKCRFCSWGPARSY